MGDDEPFLLEALLAVLPYVVAGTAGWLNRVIVARRQRVDALS